MKIYKASSFLIKFYKSKKNNHELEVNIAENIENAGTPLYLFNSKNYTAGIFGSLSEVFQIKSNNEDLFLSKLNNDQIKLSGVFAVFIFDKNNNSLKMFTDVLGVQSIYFIDDKDEKFISSVSLGWLLKEIGHQGEINKSSFLEHFAFGYNITFNETPYLNVKKIPIGYKIIKKGILSYKKNKFQNQSTFIDLNNQIIDELIERLTIGSQPPINGLTPFIGLSSGKDCLCLSSLVHEKKYKSGTFGVLESPDQKQGKLIASKLGFNHLSMNVASKSEFSNLATIISYFSGGLGTISMLDFLKFYLGALNPDNYFIIGEGGENIRSFFDYDGQGDPIQTLKSRYLTEKNVLMYTLSSEVLSEFKQYPDFYIQKIKDSLPYTDKEILMINFYRYKRMGGNFSLRNAILSPFRAKVSPFLDYKFMNLSFNLDKRYYQENKLHRILLNRINPSLLNYFDNPILDGPNYQNIFNRFTYEDLGNHTYDLLNLYLDFVPNIFDKKNILDLCLNNIKKPSRDIFYILRVLSFSCMYYLLSFDVDNKILMIKSNKRLLFKGI